MISSEMIIGSKDLQARLIASEELQVRLFVWEEFWVWCHLGGASSKALSLFFFEFSTYSCDTALK